MAPPADYIDHFEAAQTELAAATVARQLLADKYAALAAAHEAREATLALADEVEALRDAARHTLMAAEVHARLAQVQAIQGEAGL